MLTPSAIALAFDGRWFTLTANDGSYRQARRQHALADLSGAFRFKLVAEHRPDFGHLGVELPCHVLEPVRAARQSGNPLARPCCRC